MRPPLAALLTLPILIVALLACRFGEASDTWRGLVVAAENRCSPYDRDDYYYPQSLEDQIIAALGGIYSPYTGEKFASKRETDIEHMVAVSEAHDSGLCAADAATKHRFASDLLNLTLAAPDLNRYVKRAHDAADWLPEWNRCWFAARVVEVRLKYDLTIDRREADALEAVLSRCSSPELVIDLPMPQLEGEPTSPAEPLELWDSNGNGRITCAEAREHGIAPVPRDHPAYRFMRDADGDGMVCE